MSSTVAPNPTSSLPSHPPSSLGVTTTVGQTTSSSVVATPFHHAQPPWTIPTFTHLRTPLSSLADRAALYQAMVADADCMWTHGIPDWPEPNPHYGDGHTQPGVIGVPPAPILT